MENFLKMAFLIGGGGFFLYLLVYAFYIGLKPEKKNSTDISKRNTSSLKL